ncbi:FIST N-terminal domain-containing protein [Candidatus Thiothrix sp. Deng01]|uniref:FIST N-terminal domain-containing protein n=1 Tax=Candidatus Thiothrix phosphatis TaxID=3112415 RepID=A0ABU6D397_9GAMM|nr:FIST N-terminal domain-containing protein [Candidatus Thiothrix sp. Deng01]MEB4592804.1 FIST N-terminal domain-containing protein [Candidatus Thiothrix sp. Deng01]
MKVDTLSYTIENGFSASLPEINTPTLLILVFGDSSFLEHPQPFVLLAEKYPQAQLMGCSSAGEIRGGSIQDHSLVIALVQFESASLRMTCTDINDPLESRHVGRLLAGRLNRENLQGIFVLSDGLCVNGSELAHGFNDITNANTIVTGGLAGDGERFKTTWVLQDGKPAGGVVAALGLYGNAHIQHGSNGGWKPFGPARKVTRAEHNILYELSGKPALALYKTYLGELAEGLPATGLRFPLALSQPGETTEVVRTILAVDEANQSLIFAGDIPEGAQAQLMRANLDQLVEGAENAALMSATDTDKKVLCIAISCIGRRMVLGTDAEEEAEAVLANLPKNTSQLGFYSYGELSPFSTGECGLHNQTMTITTIYE